MKTRKAFDCVEMKRRIQAKIYEETKDLSRAELIDYYRRHAETGPFAELWKEARSKAHSAKRTRRTKS